MIDAKTVTAIFKHFLIVPTFCPSKFILVPESFKVMALSNRLKSLSYDYAETILRFVLPIFVHWFHVNIVNSIVNIVMLEPDFGSMVFVIACSLYLRQFKTVILHEVYRSDIDVIRIIQEVSKIYSKC